MPSSYYLKIAKEKIRLSSKPFAGGGEGNLYRITSPANYKGYVAKIYHPPKQTALREQKVNYLINHPPHESVNDPNQHSPIVWITDGLYKNGRFVGFIMPFVKGEKLEVLCLSKLPRKLSGEWRRFDRKNPRSWELRLRICFNLATAIYQIHSADRYVLVDLKPDNVVVQPNGLISIVDTDSVEVIENGRAIFPAPVATPEYTPPEFYKNTHRTVNSTVGESWDRFGLAVIFYKLILGIHPFTASSLPPYEQLVSLHNKIEHGLFVFAPDKKKFIQQPIPAPHKVFHGKLNPELRELFIGCFVEGNNTPALRPTAGDWCYAFIEAMNDDRIRRQFEHLINGMPKRRASLRMPSTMSKALVLKNRPNTWIDKLIDQDFELPQLPVKVHNQLNKTANQKAILLDKTDIFMSWVAFLSAFVLLCMTSGGWWTWLTETIWTFNAFTINLFFIGLLLLPQLVIPFIIYAGRSLIDPEKKHFQRLQDLKNLYPIYQQKLLTAKQDLLGYIDQKTGQHSGFYSNRKKLRTTTEQFLKMQDEQVKGLLEDEQKTLDELQQEYITKAKQNSILAGLEGDTLEDLRRALVKAENTALNTTRRSPNYNDDVRASVFYANRLQAITTQNVSKVETVQRRVKHRITQLEIGLKEDKALLLSPFQMQNDFVQNKAKLIPGTKEDRVKVLQFFNVNSLRYLSEIDEVLPGQILLLKDGRQLDLKLIDFATRNTFCYKVTAELPKVKTQQENLDQSIRILERKFISRKIQIETEAKLEYEAIDKEFGRKKNSLYTKAEKDYYNHQYESLVKAYHDAVHHLKAVKEEHSRMVDNISNIYSERYKSILNAAEEHVDKAKLKIEQLEMDYRHEIHDLVEQNKYSPQINLPSIKDRTKIEQHIKRLNK
ncbi:MAG: hypothetical protein GY810_02700 [Aureispira sp.]|nr:hypothetical protein [Aureispira sp.]